MRVRRRRRFSIWAERMASPFFSQSPWRLRMRADRWRKRLVKERKRRLMAGNSSAGVETSNVMPEGS
jgi:hypothetical protein